MNLSGWINSAKTFEFEGHQISYHDTARSDSNTILFLHGFPTASWDWRHLWSNLKSEYRLIALDFLGYGYSDKPRDHDYSINEQANIVESLLKHLEITKLHIAAHDIGNNVAQELLARQEENSASMLIRSILFLNGALFPELQRHTVLQTLISSRFGFLLSAFTTRPLFEKQFISIFGEASKPSKAELDNVWDLVSHKQGHKLSHKLMSYIDDRKRYGSRWVKALQNTSVPSLFINGNSDPISGLVMLKQYSKLGSSTTGHGLEGVGHYPHCEEAMSVELFYKSFLKAQSK